MQIINDQHPYVFLFGALSGVTLTFQNCTLLSPCGGWGDDYMHKALTAALPRVTAIRPVAQNISPGLTYDALMPIPFAGGPADAQIHLLNTSIQCYPPPTLYAPRQEPGIWTPGAAAAASDRYSLCQRPETLGADYRGERTETRSGSPCTSWSVPSLQVPPCPPMPCQSPEARPIIA